jgi:hypothetical protein
MTAGDDRVGRCADINRRQGFQAEVDTERGQEVVECPV